MLVFCFPKDPKVWTTFTSFPRNCISSSIQNELLLHQWISPSELRNEGVLIKLAPPEISLKHQATTKQQPSNGTQHWQNMPQKLRWSSSYQPELANYAFGLSRVEISRSISPLGMLISSVSNILQILRNISNQICRLNWYLFRHQTREIRVAIRPFWLAVPACTT